MCTHAPVHSSVYVHVVCARACVGPCMGTCEGNREVSGVLSQGSNVAQASSGLSLLSSRKAQATHPVQESVVTECQAAPPGSLQAHRDRVQPAAEGGLGLQPQSKEGPRSSWSPKRCNL